MYIVDIRMDTIKMVIEYNIGKYKKYKNMIDIRRKTLNAQN